MGIDSENDADDVDGAVATASLTASLTADELLGRAVLRLRLYRGWSQRELERISRVDQSTISRLETGHRSNLGAGRLSAVLHGLGVGEAWLLPRPDEVERTPLERMLFGDPWQRAVIEADRRVARRRGRGPRVSRRRSA